MKSVFSRYVDTLIAFLKFNVENFNKRRNIWGVGASGSKGKEIHYTQY